MLEVLTNPNGFFHKKINDEVEMKTPFMIMAVLMVIIGLTGRKYVNVAVKISVVKSFS